jgi:hypothetical protein
MKLIWMFFCSFLGLMIWTTSQWIPSVQGALGSKIKAAPKASGLSGRKFSTTQDWMEEVYVEEKLFAAYFPETVAEDFD